MFNFLNRQMRSILWLIRNLGFDPVVFMRALRDLPYYLRDYLKFQGECQAKINIRPCLHNRFTEAGVTKSEYFWQDLIVARWIHAQNPICHVDVGSRTDGFVAHVASFREIEVFDVRPISTVIPGLIFRQVDLMDSEAIGSWRRERNVCHRGYCDSLSCLHVLEHFGLGRYGDPVDPNGYKTGFANLVSLLRPGGVFYLSTPIGRERVEFNANWVFDPATILALASRHALKLKRFCVFNPRVGLKEIEETEWSKVMTELAAEYYNLGIFVFSRG